MLRKPTVIETVEQIDAEWLTTVLGRAGVAATVRSVTSERVGAGQMGSCFRLRIEYADGAGPGTVDRETAGHRAR